MKYWRGWLAPMAVLAVAAPCSALAASLDSPVAFNVPAQSLDTALLAFSRQSGIQVISASPAVATRQGRSVTGIRTPRAALATLLADTRLTFVATGNDTVTIIAAPRAMGLASLFGRRPARQSPRAPPQPPDSPPASDINALDAVIVTGSRTTLNGANSPTPVTIVATAQLQATTPSNIPDGLNKLPMFQGSRGATTLGNATTNATGNFLNLRGLGVIRTLILQDGRRLPPSAANGTVDTNTLPQLLVRRIDVVTDGASAVYGSEAVAGVVNFILDRNFQGLKIQGSAGISSRGDDPSWQVGFAAGKSYLDGRLHLEGSLEHYSSAGIDDKAARPIGSAVYCASGAGTKANPFRLTASCRNNTSSFGGLIRTGPLSGLEFASNGVLTPFVHGVATGTSSVESGGDGFYQIGNSLAAYLESEQGFGRADYDFGNNVTGYVQLSAARSRNGNAFNPPSVNAAISTSNAFLTPSQQVAAAAGGATSFQFGRFFTNEPQTDIKAKTTNTDLTLGLEGKAGRLNWDVYYTVGRSRTQVSNIGILNNGRLYASLDAVRDPSSGLIVCSVTLTHPGLYPGCIPFNPFGPTAQAPGAFAFGRGVTRFTLDNNMDDIGLNLSGDVVTMPAGAIRLALNGDYRRTLLRNVSDAQPGTLLDCKGLRFNCVQGVTTEWGNNVTADMKASTNIAEAALEATVPLLKDLPLAQQVNLNAAFRLTRQGASAGVTTWKVGTNWRVNDAIALRSTRSRDIRAPTLFDLYQPLSAIYGGFNDIHTGLSMNLPFRSLGNPALRAETADTITFGVAFHSARIARLSITADYYDIKVDNGITSVGGNNTTVQTICENSNGASPLCDLILRPLPFSDRSAANFPRAILSQPQNVVSTRTHGIDTEINYRLTLHDVIPSLEGAMELRLFASYQPVMASMLLPGAATINAAGAANQAAWKVAGMLAYDAGPWTLNWQTRWRSSEKQSGDEALSFDIPDVSAVAFSDVTVTYNWRVGDRMLATYLSVQNLFDRLPPPYANPGGTANPNAANNIVSGDDLIGRYVTIGARLRY